MKTNDIYSKIDRQIVDKGFWNMDIAEQKKLIESELFNYTLNKLIETYVTNKMEKLSPDNLIFDLLSYVDSKLETIEEKEEFFKNYTHYILNVAGTMQGKSIDWWEEDNEELINTPYVKFNEPDNWDYIKTHRNTNPLRTTLFVYDIFKNYFRLEKQNGKQKRLNIKNKI